MSTNNKTRVVVTGLGATTPVGGTAVSTWSALLAGQSGVRTITDEWAADLPVNFAGVAAVDPTEVLDRVEARKLDRIARVIQIDGEGLDQAQRAKLMEIADKCPVHRTLHSEISVVTELE